VSPLLTGSSEGIDAGVWMISNLVKASALRKVERDKCRECVGCEGDFESYCTVQYCTVAMLASLEHVIHPGVLVDDKTLETTSYFQS
jgi:hypothetical protein